MESEWIVLVLGLVALVTVLGSGINMLVCLDLMQRFSPVLRGSLHGIPIVCGYDNPFFIGFCLSIAGLLFWATLNLMKPPEPYRVANWRLQGYTMTFLCLISATWAAGFIDLYAWIVATGAGLLFLIGTGIVDQVFLARKSK